MAPHNFCHERRVASALWQDIAQSGHMLVAEELEEDLLEETETPDDAKRDKRNFIRGKDKTSSKEKSEGA